MDRNLLMVAKKNDQMTINIVVAFIKFLAYKYLDYLFSTYEVVVLINQLGSRLLWCVLVELSVVYKE